MSIWSTMAGEWALTSAEASPALACSDPPEESCSDAACPAHGWDSRDDENCDDGADERW